MILCGSTDGWERKREAIFFALSFFQFLMNGFNADAPSDWLRTMQEGFEKLRAYPTIGDFLAYQFITDINYSEITDFSEMDFVVPGPGARDGLRKCFADPGGLNEPELIRLMADLQEQEFERLGPRLPIALGPTAPIDRLPEPVLRSRQICARRAPADRGANRPHADQAEVRADS